MDSDFSDAGVVVDSIMLIQREVKRYDHVCGTHDVGIVDFSGDFLDILVWVLYFIYTIVVGRDVVSYGDVRHLDDLLKSIDERFNVVYVDLFGGDCVDVITLR